MKDELLGGVIRWIVMLVFVYKVYGEAGPWTAFAILAAYIFIEINAWSTLALALNNGLAVKSSARDR